MQRLQPAQAKELLSAKEELAFVDVREHGQYGEGHPFFAVNLPYSQLELKANDLVPRKTVHVLLLDDNDGVAEKAAKRLSTLGYANIDILEGGAPAWKEAGYTLFKGVNLPSKAFGELVEHAMGTPSLTVEELQAKRGDGSKLILLDGRSAEEFRKMNIPGARSCPNAELVHRLPLLTSDPETTIVINCAGRTRSIIGAQSLRNLHPANNVYALHNGTQGWCLAGLKLERGSDPGTLTELDAATLAVSRDRSESLISRFCIPQINRETLAVWQVDDSRTFYLFDVRTQGEYSDGHLDGALHAPGGQLVQATDQWVAVRGARIVLSDDTGLRAANTALWLRGMGHDVSVLDYDAREGDATVEPSTNDGLQSLPIIAPGAAAELLADDAILLDVSPGMAYRKAHIQNSIWATRPRLDTLKLHSDQDIILASGIPGMAELAAIDLHEAGHTRLSFLEGTPGDWRKAGLTIVASNEQPSDADCIDFLFFVHSRHDGDLEASRRYLEWEVNLLNQVDTQELSTLNPPVEFLAT